MPKFPGPKYNSLISSDPQIVKVGMDECGIGARRSVMGQLGDDPKGNDPAKPTAPEMTIKHTS